MTIRPAFGPQPYTTLWPDPERGPWAVEFVLYGPTAVTGAIECVEVRIRGKDFDRDADPLQVDVGELALPIPATFFRRLPIGDMVGRTKDQLARLHRQLADMEPPEWADDDSPASRMARQAPEVFTKVAKMSEPRKRRTLRRKQRPSLEEIARVYDEAFRYGAPTLAVHNYFKVPRSTANKWVALAREAGLIQSPKPIGRGMSS